MNTEVNENILIINRTTTKLILRCAYWKNIKKKINIKNSTYFKNYLL